MSVPAGDAATGAIEQAAQYRAGDLLGELAAQRPQHGRRGSAARLLLQIGLRSVVHSVPA